MASDLLGSRLSSSSSRLGYYYPLPPASDVGWPLLSPPPNSKSVMPPMPMEGGRQKTNAKVAHFLENGRSPPRDVNVKSGVTECVCQYHSAHRPPSDACSRCLEAATAQPGLADCFLACSASTLNSQPSTLNPQINPQRHHPPASTSIYPHPPSRPPTSSVHYHIHHPLFSHNFVPWQPQTYTLTSNQRCNASLPRRRLE